jgi:diguanylate cyclase (GGDEF)-like protein/PAS domain S-box-containing protein
MRPRERKAVSVPRAHGSVPNAWQRELGRLVFAARHTSIVALAVLAAVVPSIGPNRWWIAGAVLGLVLPWDLLMHWWTRRTGRPPVVMFLANQLFGAAFIALAPTVYVPTLLALVADIGLAIVIFGRRTSGTALAFGVLVVGCAAFSVDTHEPLVGMFGYVIAGASLIAGVGALFESERRLRNRHLALLGDVDAIVWEAVHAPTRRYTFASERANAILGFPATQWTESGFWQEHIHPDDLERVLAEDADAFRGRHDVELEYRMISADGRVVCLRDLVTVVIDDAGQALGLRGVMIDITAQRGAEERFRQYADLVERIQMALLVARLVDPADSRSLEVVAANPMACALSPHGLDDLVGYRVVDVFPRLVKLGLHEHLARVVATGEPYDLDDLEPDRAAGGVVHYSVHAFPLGPDLVGVSLDDVTGPSLAAQALRRQATHDTLTGLPNRALLNDRLRRALREATQNCTTAALLVMDLDQFKEINDALGHHAGDQLLVAMSRRLEDMLGDSGLIARLGGDEFAILLTENADRAGATAVAQLVERALEQPFEVEGISLQTNASLGIALYPDHATDPELLAQRADVAMYQAKRSAHSFAMYAAEHDHSSVRRVTLLGELRRAVEFDEFRLFHQPTFSLATGALVGTEALVRWQHPVHGLMGPSEFIDLAEVSGMIHPLTRWAFKSALYQAGAWAEPGEEPTIGVSINLSVRNLYDPELTAWMEALLVESNFPPSLVTLELTESEVMDDPFLAVEVLGQLRALGVHTSIDDFGTGHSALAYLKHLPIDEIKIDQSFVAGLRTSRADETIVRAIIDLGHNLGLTVVAEGVEDDDTLQRLRDLGCDRAQGYHLSPPVTCQQIPTVASATNAPVGRASVARQ